MFIFFNFCNHCSANSAISFLHLCVCIKLFVNSSCFVLNAMILLEFFYLHKPVLFIQRRKNMQRKPTQNLLLVDVIPVTHKSNKIELKSTEPIQNNKFYFKRTSPPIYEHTNSIWFFVCILFLNIVNSHWLINCHIERDMFQVFVFR